MPTSLRTMLQRLEVDPVDLRLLARVRRGEPVHPALRPMDADLGDSLTRPATGVCIHDLPLLPPERVWAALPAAQPPSPPHSP